VPTAVTENWAVEPTVTACGWGSLRISGAVWGAEPEVGSVTESVIAVAGPAPSALLALAVSV
jgi:hypothetical protein